MQEVQAPRYLLGNLIGPTKYMTIILMELRDAQISLLQSIPFFRWQRTV